VPTLKGYTVVMIAAIVAIAGDKVEQSSLLPVSNDRYTLATKLKNSPGGPGLNNAKIVTVTTAELFLQRVY